MAMLRVCLEIQGLARDAEGNACPGGLCISLGEILDDEANAEMTKKLMERADIAAILRATPLEGLVKPSDCRVITPEEFDEKYGDDDEE